MASFTTTKKHNKNNDSNKNNDKNNSIVRLFNTSHPVASFTIQLQKQHQRQQQYSSTI